MEGAYNKETQYQRWRAQFMGPNIPIVLLLWMYTNVQCC